jgi:hypothetical protein
MGMTDSEQYLDTWTKTANLYADGRLSEALTIADEMVERYPQRWSSVAHARACLLTSLNRTDEALAVMRETVNHGRWWSKLQLSDGDLDGIRDKPEFTSLVVDMSRLAEIQRNQPSRAPEPLVFTPPDQRAFVLVALHMYGVPAEETAPHWLPATDSGGVLVVPQSSQVDADGNPIWEDDEITDRDIAVALDEVHANSPADLPLIVAGASQGARHAMRFAVQGSFSSCRGFFVVAGAADPGTLDPFLDESVARGLHGVILAGAEDRLVAPYLKTVSDALSGRGIPTHFEEIPNLGHWFPTDFPDRLKKELDFLLSR